MLVPVLASIGSLYDRAIVDTGRQPEFLFFVSFLVTFGFIRTSAHMIRAQVSWWPGNVEVGGTHIHHLVWGILLLMITGYVGVVDRPAVALARDRRGPVRDRHRADPRRVRALAQPQGRLLVASRAGSSIDAVIVAATITGMVLVGFTAWVDVATEVEDAVFAFVGAFGVLAILVALVNLAKEKFGVALVGLFISPVGLVGAFRLGQAALPVGARFYRERKTRRGRGRGSASPPRDRSAGRASQSAAGSG